jgi:hypothetical protein
LRDAPRLRVLKINAERQWNGACEVHVGHERGVAVRGQGGGHRADGLARCRGRAGVICEIARGRSEPRDRGGKRDERHVLRPRLGVRGGTLGRGRL